MADTVKFTEEELSEIKELQNLYNTVVFQAGQVHLDEIALHEKKGQVEANFAEVKNREQEIISKLTKFGSSKFITYVYPNIKN